MRRYRGVIVVKFFMCDECGAAFYIPITVGSDEGDYSACPCCKGIFINKQYKVDGMDDLFESRDRAEEAIDLVLEGRKI